MRDEARGDDAGNRADHPQREAANDVGGAHPMPGRNWYYLAYGLIVSGLAAIVIVAESVSPDVKDALLKEGGPVESLSAIGYFVCAVALVFAGRSVTRYWYIVVMLLMFGLRELDMHRHLVTGSMTKLRFYTGPDVPVREKILAVAVIALFLYSAVRVVRNHAGPFVKSIRRAEPCALGAALGILFMLFAKAIDGLSRRHPEICSALGDPEGAIAHGIEEVAELGIPLMFLVAIAARPRE